MEKYVPDVYQESIYKINYEMLYSKGIKCLLFDLDNTLVTYREKISTDELKKLMSELKEKFQVVIFSNAMKKRVKKIADELEIDYVARAHKPSSKEFLNVIKKYKLAENEVAIIGDQLLTDIKGGNTVGIITVLVDQLEPYDPFYTKINRMRENKIKKRLRKNNLFKGRYYDEKM